MSEKMSEKWIQIKSFNISQLPMMAKDDQGIWACMPRDLSDDDIRNILILNGIDVGEIEFRNWANSKGEWAFQGSSHHIIKFSHPDCDEDD